MPLNTWRLKIGANNAITAEFVDANNVKHPAVPPVPNYVPSFLDAADGSDESTGRLHEATAYVAGLNAARDPANQH